MFENMIRDWFMEENGSYNDFIRAFLSGDLKEMNAYMNRIALDTFSYFNTGKNGAEPECFYHGFVLGLMVELADRYVLTSNRESGFGRYDIMLEPKEMQAGIPSAADALIIEFKVQNKEERTLSDTVKTALDQIEKQQYAQRLTARGIPEEKIHKYGFAFSGKEVLIGAGDIE